MIQTLSQFYYGQTVGENNFWLDFREGAGAEISAQVDIGEYTLTDFANAVAKAMNLVGTLNYVVTVNRATRVLTISGSGAFTLLASSGTHATSSVFGLLGFLSDTSSLNTHTGSFASGSVWRPQFRAQDYVDFEDQQDAIDGVVRQSTSGKVESVKFGNKKIMDANFVFITDIFQPPGFPIENDSMGVLNARSFLEYAITKADIEWMPDRNKPNEYKKVVLESTPEDREGLGFKLKEQYSRGLVGYYETGILKFRLL